MKRIAGIPVQVVWLRRVTSEVFHLDRARNGIICESSA